MTQDFRQSSAGSGANEAVRAGEELPAQQQLVLRVLTLSALVFVLAGAAMLVFEPEFLPAETRPFLVAAFFLAAISDVIVVRVLRRVWQRRSGG